MHWGEGGAPQPLSSVLGAGGGGGGSGGGGFGGDASSEDGRHGDDETSEEGGYDYKAAASQLWGDDSEEEVRSWPWRMRVQKLVAITAVWVEVRGFFPAGVHSFWPSFSLFACVAQFFLCMIDSSRHEDAPPPYFNRTGQNIVCTQYMVSYHTSCTGFRFSKLDYRYSTTKRALPNTKPCVVGELWMRDVSIADR